MLRGKSEKHPFYARTFLRGTTTDGEVNLPREEQQQRWGGALIALAVAFRKLLLI